MIENLKAILLNDLNEEVAEYNQVKEQYEQMAKKIEEDNSDQEYDQRKKDLKKEYGMKRFSKKSDYSKKLQEIEEDYQNNLKEFRDFFDEYTKVKQRLAKWNIYHTKKRIEEIPHYKTLKDFRMTKEKMEELLSKTGLADTLTEEEQKQVNKLR